MGGGSRRDWTEIGRSDGGDVDKVFDLRGWVKRVVGRWVFGGGGVKERRRRRGVVDIFDGGRRTVAVAVAVGGGLLNRYI